MGTDSSAPLASQRTYLRVRPATEPLQTDRLTAQFAQLHQGQSDAVIEVLLVADPTADEIAYYFGIDEQYNRLLQRTLHRIFPDAYAIEPVDDHPLTNLFTTDDTDIAAAEFLATGNRADDWQTRLRPPTFADAPAQHQTARVEAAPGLPLESIVEQLAFADGPVVYQTLLTPKADWSYEADDRVWQLEHREDTWGQQLSKLIFGEPGSYEESTIEDRRNDSHRQRRDSGTPSDPGSRIASILAKSANRSFEVNARIVATGSDAHQTISDCTSAFGAIGGDYYRIQSQTTTGEEAADLLEAVKTATVHAGDDWRTRLRRWFPLAGNQTPQIIADSTTVPHFSLLDGTGLTESARRSLRAIPDERTGVTPPDDDALTHYESGLPLGTVRNEDGTTLDTTVSLPPALQPMHVAWFGKTGSGKTTSLENAILGNHAATDGADLIVAPKGDGMPREYLRAHYAEYGTLDDVYYFDCAEVVPALSFFDIRDQLADGISRTTAVEETVDHYVEILRGVMTEDAFDSAVRSPDIIRYLVKALFDPEHGADAYTHRDLQEATRRLRESQTPPQVSDAELREMLGGVTENDQQAFDRIMQGVANRIEKIPLDDRLGRVFNHVSDADGPAFDLRDVLNEDVVVIFDMGGLRSASQRALTLVVLSELWTALRRRAEATEDSPLVNLYLEEAATLAVSDLLDDLLSQSRGFGLSVTLAMQFPGQLREQAPRTYTEVMNNVGSIITGNVAVDTQLQQRLATEEMPPEAVGNRLRALSRGEWMATLAASFGERRPQPFILESLSLPPGHPEGDEPLSEPREAAFDALFTAVSEQTAQEFGLAVGDSTDSRSDAPADQSRAAADADRVDSALPHTERLPDCVDYHPEAHALVCTTCDGRYDASAAGMERAIGCCHDVESVTRDDIPVCDLPLTLTPNERLDSDCSLQQLLFLQAVYAAQHGQFTTLEYDLLRDSMTLLQTYVGLDDGGVAELIDRGLLRNDGTTPHQLYTVTHEGRAELHEPHRDGDVHGHGKGDVAESSFHTLLVELGRRHIEATYVDDPGSSVVGAHAYYDAPDGDGRFDAVGLDADGKVVVTLEAERSNNDLAAAVPADFDKMAAVEPEAAIWVVRTQAVAHEVLGALNDPKDGTPRVEKTYSENSPPSRWKIDTPGFSQVRTVTQLRQELAFN